MISVLPHDALIQHTAERILGKQVHILGRGWRKFALSQNSSGINRTDQGLALSEQIDDLPIAVSTRCFSPSEFSHLNGAARRGTSDTEQAESSKILVPPCTLRICTLKGGPQFKLPKAAWCTEMQLCVQMFLIIGLWLMFLN